MRTALVSLLLVLAHPLLGLDYRPWYSEPLLPVAHAAYQYQTFPRVQATEEVLNQRETAHTGCFTLSFSPTDEINGQAEVLLTGTTAHGFFFDRAAIAARYLLANDVIGDPFSLSVGGTLIVPSTTSLRDFATPPLGPVDLEAHVAIGKERSFGPTWFRRVWAVGALIASTNGSPALWAKLALAFNQCDRFYIEGFSIGCLGLGRRDLSRDRPFEGYGPYATRTVDLGARMAVAGSYGSTRLEYRYRPYAHNYPQNAHTIIISLIFPLAI